MVRKLWLPHPWTCSKPTWMWHLRTWIGPDHGAGAELLLHLMILKAFSNLEDPTIWSPELLLHLPSPYTSLHRSIIGFNSKSKAESRSVHCLFQECIPTAAAGHWILTRNGPPLLHIQVFMWQIWNNPSPETRAAHCDSWYKSEATLLAWAVTQEGKEPPVQCRTSGKGSTKRRRGEKKAGTSL